MKNFFFIILCLSFSVCYSQKVPLDHSVYDDWQSIGEKIISNNGKFAAYVVNPQQGDGTLFLKGADGTLILKADRGYNLKFTDDNKFLIFKIKPTYNQTRDAKIKKKKPDEMPKDSLGIFDITLARLEKIERVKSYKMPEKNTEWLAYQMEKTKIDLQVMQEMDSVSRIKKFSKIIDSFTRVTDSLRNKLNQVQTLGLSVLQGNKAVLPKAEENNEEGTELILRNMITGKIIQFKSVNDYVFNKYGNSFVVKTIKNKNIPALLLKEDLTNNKLDTIFKKFNDVKMISLDDKGEQIAFTAERDSSKKESQKYYRLYYYKNSDSAVEVANRFTKGIPKNWGVSENGIIYFSKSGKRLFFGTAPIIPLKDTTLPEFERVSVDVWNYKDEDLMPYQLRFNDTLLKRNFFARYDFDKKEVIQLGDLNLTKVVATDDGDGKVFYGASDFGKRVEKQWQGYTLEDWYDVNPETGEKKLIVKDFKGTGYPSYKGNYLLLYNDLKKSYFTYNPQSKSMYPVATDIKYPLYEEEFDEPTDPNQHGIAKWMENDQAVLVYDRYDVWKVDPLGKKPSFAITNGRKEKIQFRYESVTPDEKFITANQPLIFRTFNEKDKAIGVTTLLSIDGSKSNEIMGPYRISSVSKAKENNSLLYVGESYVNSPNVFIYNDHQKEKNTEEAPLKLSNTNLQQSKYNWGTSEIFKWKAYTGKLTEGLLFKPENFEAGKKYPMIVYFYDRSSNTLHFYQPPSPTPSRLNIPFFVSRGYVVFVPDIWYTTGHPGKSAYDYIVSGTRELVKKGFIDSTKIGIQGQSWGGYQTAYVITQTNLFSAAWAGAPVVNMFSAYGGVRWESGSNRQMQYEKGQSRIGATIWEKPQLYIENSPLFHLQKIKTPLVIMSNDADGAVPWYQGIEFFTDMRRLHKPVWLLNYNGEAHNLVERKNRKDIQIREQQFFDWKLKNSPAPKWITEGVPAIMKGRDLGLGM